MAADFLQRIAERAAGPAGGLQPLIRARHAEPPPRPSRSPATSGATAHRGREADRRRAAAAHDVAAPVQPVADSVAAPPRAGLEGEHSRRPEPRLARPPPPHEPCRATPRPPHGPRRASPPRAARAPTGESAAPAQAAGEPPRPRPRYTPRSTRPPPRHGPSPTRPRLPYESRLMSRRNGADAAPRAPRDDLRASVQPAHAGRGRRLAAAAASRPPRARRAPPPPRADRPPTERPPRPPGETARAAGAPRAARVAAAARGRRAPPLRCGSRSGGSRSARRDLHRRPSRRGRRRS